MFDLGFRWLCLPYAVCAAALAAIGVVAALVRGDRVLRLGVIGAATTAMVWAICSSLATCTDDPVVATRLLRLGVGPVALIGPNFLLVLLGISGQLERHRWAASVAGVTGSVLLGVCWGTEWTVPGVHRLPSGVFYVTAGPLTDVHVAQLGFWLAVGLVIARRSMMRGERRRMMRLVIAAVVLAALGGTDMLLVHGVAGVYPIAWLPATIACGITLYLELRTDLLRPRGFDRGVLFELIGFTAAAVLIGALAFLLQGAAPVAVAAIASAVWMLVTATMWGLGRQRPPRRVFGERALEELVAKLTDIDDDKPIAEGLSALWQQVSITVRATWRVEPSGLHEIMTGAVRELAPDIAAWLVAHPEPIAVEELATMRLGSIRPKLEAIIAVRGATLYVPLLDRGTLVGLVEADHVRVMREAERGLVVESARAAARALTYVSLARIAAREGATAREVEVAEAMRLQASASRDDELGPWAIAAEYRSAARTTGAAWSANLLGDGRLAILVTEGQAHGVVAALATAALTGAFVAATTVPQVGTLDELIATLGASAEGVLRGGEPIAAFLAIIDGEARTITWSCAGHPGAVVISPQGLLRAGAARDASAAHASAAHDRSPSIVSSSAESGLIPLGGGGAKLGELGGDPGISGLRGLPDGTGGALRGVASFDPDMVVVIASSGVRGTRVDDSKAWHGIVREHAAAGSRLAKLLVEAAPRRGQPGEDLLAVVIRQRQATARPAPIS